MESLTRALNLARKHQNSSDIKTALENAATWLRVKRTLTEEQLKTRGHLIAAIHTIATSQSTVDSAQRKTAEALYQEFIAVPT
jgi:hypothetical protein